MAKKPVKRKSLGDMHANAGRDIIKSILALTTDTIEDFERGRDPEELEAHYRGVSRRMEGAATGR